MGCDTGEEHDVLLAGGDGGIRLGQSIRSPRLPARMFLLFSVASRVSVTTRQVGRVSCGSSFPSASRPRGPTRKPSSRSSASDSLSLDSRTSSPTTLGPVMTRLNQRVGDSGSDGPSRWPLSMPVSSESTTFSANQGPNSAPKWSSPHDRHTCSRRTSRARTARQ